MPKGGNKATKQISANVPLEPFFSPVANKVDPTCENVGASAQQSEDVTATDVKMEDNPVYNTSVL